MENPEKIELRDFWWVNFCLQLNVITKWQWYDCREFYLFEFNRFELVGIIKNWKFFKSNWKLKQITFLTKFTMKVLLKWSKTFSKLIFFFFFLGAKLKFWRFSKIIIFFFLFFLEWNSWISNRQNGNQSPSGFWIAIIYSYCEWFQISNSKDIFKSHKYQFRLSISKSQHHSHHIISFLSDKIIMEKKKKTEQKECHSHFSISYYLSNDPSFLNKSKKWKKEILHEE